MRVSAYRVGWYRGAQARLVWRSDEIGGRRQREMSFASASRTVATRWAPVLTVPTGGWPEGAYLLRLDASHGHQRYVSLIVRSADGAGKTVIMHAPETWHSYCAGRTDRGSRWLHHGVDIDRAPSVLRGATAVYTLGHDEYWTPRRRAAITRARDADINVAFLGANTCTRRIRLAPGGGTADRSVICYKTDVGRDPMYSADPALATTDYRLPRAPDPESSLTGVIYEGYPVDAPYVKPGRRPWPGLCWGPWIRRAGRTRKQVVGDVQIRGPRLLLRALQPGEIEEEWQAMVTADPMVIAELPEEASFKARLRRSGHLEDGWLDLAINLNSVSVGRIQTFVPPGRALPPGTFDVGIGLREDARGKGYGREALALLTDWLFEHAAAGAVEASTDPANAAMRTVFRKAGWMPPAH